MINRDDIISYVGNIINNRADFKFNTEEDFLGLFFPINDEIEIGNARLTVKQDRYDRIDRRCDRILQNENQKMWIEGKKEIVLLPINDNYINESILMPNETFFLDIARLTALINQENDLRFLLSLIENDRIEYYRTKLSKIHVQPNQNDNFETIETVFCLSDYYPVQSNRKKIINLSYAVKLDLHIFNQTYDQKKIILVYVKNGYVNLTVYRDICDASNEGKTDQFGIGFSGDSSFLERYFPAS